jgi:hypothetical protein
VRAELTGVKVTLCSRMIRRRALLRSDTLGGRAAAERWDRMEELLVDDDIATLKHHAQEGMARTALPWPASAGLAPKFMRTFH